MLSEFPHTSDLIYLNHAAVSPWPNRTREAVERFAQENYHRGAANYPNWLLRESQLREQLQQLINAPSVNDIALVKNTSEAISFVAFGLPWKSGDNIVSINEEFPSNRIPWEVVTRKGVELRRVDCSFRSNPEDALFEVIDKNTKLVAVSSVQYGSGLRLDLERIGRYCHTRDILFLVDAIQSLGALQFDVQACGADFVMADGHKWMLGPEGLGVFYCSPKGRELLELSQYGWHMVEKLGDYTAIHWEIAKSARRFECGSPNMLGIHALSASLSLLLEVGMNSIEDLILQRATFLLNKIQAESKLFLLSSQNRNLQSGILVFRHKLVDSDTAFSHLKKHGVICALRGGGIRLSPHFYTPFNELEEAINIAVQAS